MRALPNTIVQLTPYDTYLKLKQLGRVSRIAANAEANDPTYSISMQATDVEQLKRMLDDSKLIRLRCIESDVNANENANSSKAMPLSVRPPPPPGQHSAEHMLNALNDDCLREIFKSSALNVWDLAAIAHVCRRFDAIAYEVFRGSKVGRAPIVFDTVELWRIEECLRSFGPLIKWINLSELGEPSTDVVLRLVLKYCNNLTSLSCEANYGETIDAMRRILPKLKHLELKDSTGNFFKLFTPNTEYSLEKLCIECDDLSLPTFQLPNLIDLSLSGRCVRPGPPLESAFFAQNPQLELLNLSNVHIIGGIDTIVQHMPNLSALHLDSLDLSPRSRFADFKQLKRFSLCSADSKDFEEILQAFYDGRVAIEWLSLGWTWVDSIIDTICKMKSIMRLRLRNQNAAALRRIVRELEHLKHFEASGLSRLGWTDALDEIRWVLEHGQRMQTITYHIYPLFIGADGNRTVDGRALQAIESMARDRHIELRVCIRFYANEKEALAVREVWVI